MYYKLQLSPQNTVFLRYDICSLKSKNAYDYLTMFFLRWPMAIAFTGIQYCKLISDFFA